VFGSLTPGGVGCACGAFKGVGAPIVVFGATVFGLLELSQCNCVIL